jgi:hypothetical protein
LRYSDRSWTVEATRGARQVVKPSPVSARSVRRVAELTDNDELREVVEDTLVATRELVERQAAELRAKLASMEAALADLDG